MYKRDVSFEMTKTRKRIEEISNNSDVSEKSLESYLVKRVKAFGGIALKYSNPTETGYPDRIVLLPYGITFWVELKSKGKHPRPIQNVKMDKLRSLGHKVYVADSKDSIDEILANHQNEVLFYELKNKL